MILPVPIGISLQIVVVLSGIIDSLVKASHSSILVSWRLMYWQKHPSLSLTLVLSRVMSEGQRSSSKTNEVNISYQVVLSKGCCVRLWKHLAMAVSHSSMGTMSRSIEMGG